MCLWMSRCMPDYRLETCGFEGHGGAESFSCAQSRTRRAASMFIDVSWY